jgi:hypothetical protein
MRDDVAGPDGSALSEGLGVVSEANERWSVMAFCDGFWKGAAVGSALSFGAAAVVYIAYWVTQ